MWEPADFLIATTSEATSVSGYTYRELQRQVAQFLARRC